MNDRSEQRQGGAGRRDARYQPQVTDLDQFLEPLQRNEVFGGDMAMTVWLSFHCHGAKPNTIHCIVAWQAETANTSLHGVPF